MANEDKNINDLVVGDDDPTAELEVIDFKIDSMDLSEVDAKTYNVHGDKEDAATEVPITELESDLRSRKQTIGRLQYDLEQLRAKWLGLKTEISAREAQTVALNAKLSSALENLSRNEKLASDLQRQVASLTRELLQRNQERDELQRALKEKTDGSQPVVTDGDTPDYSALPDNLRRRLQQSEKYADSIRRQLQDSIEAGQLAEREVSRLTTSLDNSSRRNAQLSDSIAQQAVKIDELQTMLENIQARHEAEIRTLRFELGAAQETAAETEVLNTQLTSELFDARSFKEELERMLGETEEQYKGRIEDLQRELAKKSRTLADYEQKLATKSEAITVLLTELAKNSGQVDSDGEIEDVFHDIDVRLSERSPPGDDSPHALTADRMTRVLIGSIDGRVIRFPLFKDRLTIGRTSDNDIQLKAAYISRRHAVIETAGESTCIVDTGSKNGLQVNSKTVSEHILSHGDRITIGNALFRYEERKMRDS